MLRNWSNWSVFKWPASPIIMGVLALMAVRSWLDNHSANTAVATVEAPAPQPTTEREPRYWGKTNQVRIDRKEDSGNYVFGDSVPGKDGPQSGCLYQVASEMTGLGTVVVTYSPYPCPPDSGREPQP